MGVIDASVVDTLGQLQALALTLGSAALELPQIVVGEVGDRVETYLVALKALDVNLQAADEGCTLPPLSRVAHHNIIMQILLHPDTTRA